ncbi:hypothetical protein OCK02_05505 (plasmid) [Rhizobium sp. TRM96647]|uniref:hypothetical protein n=1 Tax=unclassified Rhizobium TaxID=2613769 RepID=UPI001E44328F|nr:MULTISPECIES: hypothetical protein [unclassified Rhizobium]MCD2180921.1 hypothetical protein [Rhizobium sp. GN54]MCV3735654.1 hypothetical protein [Rhizobium sp. TRM96647]MCV3757583.1 hypothetical protein [Rhizobium sp. TRM96650]
MSTKEHQSKGHRHAAGKRHGTGLFGRLFSGWLGRPNYDWGCGPIDLAGSEGLDGHIARRSEFRNPSGTGRNRRHGR